MTIKEIVSALGARYASNSGIENNEIFEAFSSDLMSDVLTLDKPNVLLITGLANIQTIRTADMADIKCVVLGRNKSATQDMIDLANDSGITLIECPYSLFHINGILFDKGLKPLY